jgi:hypothetical protein
VIGPQDLFRAVRRDRVADLAAFVRRREGDVVSRVPVASCDDDVEQRRDRVDHGDDLIAFGDRECASGAEVLLNVHDDECCMAHDAS